MLTKFIKMQIFIFYIYLMFLVSVAFSSDDSPCDANWEQYKDEHCYKLFDSVHSYADAEKLCQTNNNATLAVIHYAEEQAFLTNYIFTKKKVVDNVWIGAKYVGNKLYQWEDHTSIKTYSNWATGNPKNLADHCVQMTSDEPKGKWTDEPCARRNVPICQRMILPSLKLLAETVIELKHSLQQTSNALDTSRKELYDTKKDLSETKKDLNETKNNLIKTKETVAQLKKESIPIGFTYFQLPKDKAPSELWPSMTWTDISSEYEGVFFRVVGGTAANFGQVQQENAPRMEMIHTGNDEHKINNLHGSFSNNVSIPATGWSDGLWTGATNNPGIDLFINFKHTDNAEVRPKNMAIKVYKRTA